MVVGMGVLQFVSEAWWGDVCYKGGRAWYWSFEKVVAVVFHLAGSQVVTEIGAMPKRSCVVGAGGGRGARFCAATAKIVW